MFALIALALVLLFVAALGPSYPQTWYGNWGTYNR